MKVSEWLRMYQLSGKVPDIDESDPMLAFWAGWMLGRANRHKELGHIDVSEFDAAILAAEFVEAHAR